MIAASTLLLLIGLLDLLNVVLTSKNSAPNVGEDRWKQPRAVIMGVIALAALIPVAIHSGWIAAILVAAGYAIWSTTYLAKSTPGWQLLALSGVVVVVIALLGPRLLMLVPGRASFGWFSIGGSQGWLIYQWVILAAGALLVNIVTANRIVRIVLDLVNGGPPQQIVTPRAGRFIGALERILLVVLLLAGQGISIAGIAAAKGIIRYPEISKTVREESTKTDGAPSGKTVHSTVGLSAEIFFIGTITSWLVAFATVGIIALARIT